MSVRPYQPGTEKRPCGRPGACLHQALAARHMLVVLDGTYPTRLSRALVIAAAHSHGLPIRCMHLQIPLAEAQVNVALRMVQRHGRLLDPEEMKAGRKTDRSLATPATLQFWLQFRASFPR